MLYQLFKTSQQSGVMALEPHFENPHESAIVSKYPKFLGASPRRRLPGRLDQGDHHRRHGRARSRSADGYRISRSGTTKRAKPAATLNKVADALPGLGIVAAVLGVVITMGAIDGPPAEIGHKVGAALVGTFLGILMSYGFVQPLATNMEQRVAEEGHYEQCIKAGVLAMYKGFSPMVAVEFARRVLPDEVRPTFDETEKLCKGVRAETAAAA